MKILHINTNDFRGGAAKVMMRLLESQTELGYSCNALIGEKESDSSITFPFDKLSRKIFNLECSNNGYIDYDLFGAFKLYENKLVQEADVIHLHNTHGNYLNPFAISMLSHIKPIVWSLHDMQSITGHCSYSYDCNKWMTGCGGCPYLEEYPSIQIDRTHLNWREKKDIYEHSKLFITPVAKWIGDIASQGILKGHPMQVILNGVDIDLYKSINKEIVRKKYGIPANKIIIGAVSNGGTFGQERKGGQYVQAVVDRLTDEGYDVLLVNVGGNKNGFENEHLFHTGYISNEKEMAEVYNAFDIYLFPSIADTCPLVISEAMSCGIPVVTFATGGIPELVQHGKTGYIAPYKDVNTLYEYTKQLVDNPTLREEFSKKSREYCVEHFDHRLVTKQYLDVYQRAINLFEANRNEVLYFDLEKVPDIVKNSNEFQLSEKIKETEFTKTIMNQQKMIIISNRPNNFSNEYKNISFEEARLNEIEDADIVFVDRERYQISDNYFFTMLYKGLSTDVLLSTAVLKKQIGKRFYKLASSLVKQEDTVFTIDTSFGGIIYNRTFFNNNRHAILNGETLRCSSIEEFVTELVSINLNEYINAKVTQPIYVYGAGTHTKELFEECVELKIHVCGIIDRNSLFHGETFLDQYKIVSINDVRKDIPILISSASYEYEIYKELANKVRNPLITIYNY